MSKFLDFDGHPVSLGETVVASDPHDDDMAVCGTLALDQNGRLFVVCATVGRLVHLPNGTAKVSAVRPHVAAGF